MNLVFAWSATFASAGVLALFLAQFGIGRRLFLDALAIGLTLGATIGLLLAPFSLNTNPLHFSPATLSLLFAGLPEEGVKLIGIAAFLRGHFRARDARDVTLAAGALGLGFGALENGLYLAQAGPDWAALAWQRALTTQPLHVMLGLAAGYAVTRRLGLVAWAALAATHGLFDYAAFAGVDPPAALRNLAASLGLDLAVLLRTTQAFAEVAAGLMGAFALRATGGRARPRWLGWGLAGTLGGGAVAVVLLGAVLAYALDNIGVVVGFVGFAALPFALGALSAPSPSRRFAAAALLVTLGAAALWGPAGWRWVDATRAQSLGARFAATGDFERAREAFSRAVAEAPGDFELLAQRAGVYASARRYEAALADLDAALRLAPASAALHAQRAGVNRRRNAPAAVLVDLDAAVALAPDDPNYRPLRAQVKLEAGDVEGAHADLVEASRRTPDAPLVRLIASDWKVDAGDFDAALRELNARLHVAPGDAEALFRRGRVWLYKGEFARAEADLARVAGLYPALWRFIAQARLRQFGYDALRANLPSAWPAPIARALLGEVDPDDARAQAADDGQRCEADFYFALRRLGSDSSQTSEERLKAALAECPASFIEHEGAKAELRRLAL